MRVAADEVFARHARVVRIFNGVDLPHPVLHSPFWSLYQMRENRRMPDRSETVEVFNRIVAAINEQNVSAIACLLSPDHVFVDALGNRLQGADAMEAAWRNYFVMCPDYWIRPEQ